MSFFGGGRHQKANEENYLRGGGGRRVGCFVNGAVLLYVCVL